MPIDNTIIEDVLSQQWNEDVIELVGQANKTQLDIDSFVSRLKDIPPETIEEMITGGTVSRLRAFEVYVEKLIENQIGRAAMEGFHVNLSEEPEALCTWRVESAKPCPDCAPRNGMKRTYSEWELVGLPKSGFSVCGGNCRCVIDRQGEGNFNYQKESK